jgi:rubrerythrin
MTPPPTMVPTASNGTRARPSPSVYVPPGRQMLERELEQTFDGTGLNGVFVADLLSAMTAHERAGRALYRSVAGRTNNPVLRSKYEHFGDETETHVEKLDRIVSALGGDPGYVSPHARAVEAQGTRLLETTFLLDGSIDPMTAEAVMLDAVLIAETIDHENWVSLSELTGSLPDPAASEVRELVESVLADEDDHLEWATSTRKRMVRLQAESSSLAHAGAKAEEVVERLRSWFAG